MHPAQAEGPARKVKPCANQVADVEPPLAYFVVLSCLPRRYTSGGNGAGRKVGAGAQPCLDRKRMEMLFDVCRIKPTPVGGVHSAGHGTAYRHRKPSSTTLP